MNRKFFLSIILVLFLLGGTFFSFRDILLAQTPLTTNRTLTTGGTVNITTTGPTTPSPSITTIQPITITNTTNNPVPVTGSGPIDTINTTVPSPTAQPVIIPNTTNDPLPVTNSGPINSTDTSAPPLTSTARTTTNTTNNLSSNLTVLATSTESQGFTIIVGEKIVLKPLNQTIDLNNLTWIVAEEGGGTVDDQGVYTAPEMAGIFHVIVRDINAPTAQAEIITLIVRLQPEIINFATTTQTQTRTSSTTAIDTTDSVRIITAEETTNSPLQVTQVTSVSVSNIPVEVSNVSYISPVSIDAAEIKIRDTLNVLETINNSTTSTNLEKVLKTQGEDQLYKDSNSDGISDYESIYVYNLDPLKPTPRTIYKGKEINAGEKVLLGLDPTVTALVKINPEEPIISSSTETTAYSVSEVKLSSDKMLIINGRALPNSFVTVYIYSTPTIVIVKTNDNGEWQYTLDKELDNGKHTIYAATVNNTGKILAKSQAFTFVKTAEAATLETIPPVQFSHNNTKPGILNGYNFYIILGILLVFILSILLFTGIGSRKDEVL